MAIDYSRLAIPKGTPRWKQKAEKVGTQKKAERECYQKVDARDGFSCRICKRRVGGIGMLDAAHHHHLRYRSKGGKHETSNVLLLDVKCHQAVHDGLIRLTGNADADRGVLVERAGEGGWIPGKWV